MKYIGYARKSTDEKDKQVLSIDNQISELKEFASRENLEIVDFLTEAQTAKVTGRPVFNSLVKRVEKGEAQGIISWNPDRLARNSVDGGKIIYLLDTGELQSLKFPTHWFENTPQGRFMLSIAFGQAKYYVDNLSQNVHRGLKYKIKTGVWPARAPMGYRNDRNTKSIVLYEPEARPLRKAFELYSTGKYALDDIGSFLFEHGMKNKYSGGQLNDSNLRRVLMRPFYTGYMVYNGEMFKGTHTPLVSKELFDKCQVVRKQRGYFHQVKSERYNFAFTGLIKCKYCSCSITAEHRPFYFPHTHHKADYIYYHCTKKKGECCQKGYTREEVLEVQFREIIKSLSVSEAWVDQMNKFLIQDIETQKIEDKNSSSSLETEISQTEQKLDTLLEVYLDTVIDSESYIKKKNELMERKANLVSKQKELVSDNPNWIEGVQNYITCAQKCAKIARAENNCHDLADMAKKVGSKYFLKDKQIEFCLYFPYNLLAAPASAASQHSVFVPTLEFGMSKKDSDDKSIVVQRGLEKKARDGFRPGVAPEGFLNDKGTESGLRKIYTDPERMPHIKKIFELFHSGTPAVEIHRIADEVWHFKTRQHKRLGGKPLSLSMVYSILTNPFYTGRFEYPLKSNKWYEGSHEKAVSPKVFEEIQIKLGKRSQYKLKHDNYSFTALMRCGYCNSSIVAEQKLQCICSNCKTKFSITQKNKDTCTGCGTLLESMKNPKILHYIYYRCGRKKKVDLPCKQRAVRVDNLEQQIDQRLSEVEISPLFMDWAIRQIHKMNQSDNRFTENTVDSIKRAHAECLIKIKNLLQLKISSANTNGSLLSDERFKEENTKLENELKDIEKQLAEIDNRMIQANNDTVRAFNFVTRAKERFATDDIKIKRDIFMGVGLHLTLTSRTIEFGSPEYLLMIMKMKKEAPIIAERVAPEKEAELRAQFEEKYTSIPSVLRGRESRPA